MIEYYECAQVAASLGDANDCWSVFKVIHDDDDISRELIAIAQTRTLAESIVNLLSGAGHPVSYTRNDIEDCLRLLVDDEESSEVEIPLDLLDDACDVVRSDFDYSRTAEQVDSILTHHFGEEIGELRERND